MKKCMLLVITAVMLSMLMGCVQTHPSASTETTDGLTKLSITQKCYFIDDTAREILGQTVFTVEGWLNEDGVVDGTMNVEAYPVDPQALREHQAVSLDTSLENFTVYSCQILKLLDDDCDTYYNAYISTLRPDIGLIYVFHNDEVLMAVFAESEDEVWDNYDTYFDLFLDRGQ